MFKGRCAWIGIEVQKFCVSSRKKAKSGQKPYFHCSQDENVDWKYNKPPQQTSRNTELTVSIKMIYIMIFLFHSIEIISSSKYLIFIQQFPILLVHLFQNIQFRLQSQSWLHLKRQGMFRNWFDQVSKRIRLLPLTTETHDTAHIHN